MAYAKCANSEYQFEVDTLIVEYTLYEALQRQLELTACFADDASMNTEARCRHAHTAAQRAIGWTENFDAFVKLFYLNHGQDSLTEGPRFSVRILQFLVLLNLWLQRSGVFEIPSLRMADAMCEQLRVHQLVNKAFRRHYIRSRGSPAAAVTTDLLKALPSDTNGTILLADHIVPHFLELSERLKSGLDLDHLINKKWFDMTIGLMSRAAEEKLQNLVLTGQAFEDAGHTRQELWECFAWGYYFSRRRLANDMEAVLAEFDPTTVTSMIVSIAQRQAETEDNIWEMFGDAGNEDDNMQDDGDSQPPSYEEFAEWTRVRDLALSDVLKTLHDLQQIKTPDNDESNNTAQSIQAVKQRCSLHELVSEIHEFISRMFHWIYSPDRSGKPKLVQIEEGGLQDLTDSEFESFRIRANI